MTASRTLRHRALAALAAGAWAGAPAEADELPADRRVLLRLAPNGLPAALAGFVPGAPRIEALRSGCGLLEARHADGRRAVLLFDPGTEDEWGDLLLYVVTDRDGRVLEWAGDPHPAPCERATGPPPS